MLLAFLFMDILKEYTEAVKEFQKGNRSEAARKLSRALGSETILPVVENSLERIIDNPSPVLSDGILRLMENESRKYL